jgi:OOP family OmpA-OmpF porin
MLSGKVKALETEMSDLKVRYQEEIDTLNIQKASLENQSLEDRLAKERMAKEWLAMEQHLASENFFNQKYLAVRSYFLVDEADVFKQDHQLIIRLKAMHFPAGESTILAENYELLGKLQTAILTFDDPRVIIEGHTDATGSEALNMELSMQRAEAVSQYLTSNGTLPAESISAVGYGSDHPLASNLTPAGRAMNRRIDVLIIPKTQSM